MPDPAVNAHLSVIGADKVSRGGVNDAFRILFVDTGLNTQHPGISYRYLTGASAGFISDPASKDTTVGDKSGHGTKVALIAAGNGSLEWPGGVSGNAKMMFARMLPDDYSGEHQVLAGAYTSMAQYFVPKQADVVNVASGLRWASDADGATMYEAFSKFTDAGALVVTGTGDGGLNEPSQFARLPFAGDDPKAVRDAWLVVGAVSSDQPDRMHGWSNACGVAKDNCLVAAGDVKVPDPHDPGKGLVVEHSTDYAAAQVSGAAMLVQEKFPYFDGELLRQALLGSATDLGAPGVDPIYGWGRLNAEKAAKGLSRLDWGDVHLDLSSVSGGWAGDLANDISGDGGLTIASDGRAMLMQMHGNNTYTGTTRISGGLTLALFGHIESDVEVGANTYLSLKDGATLGGDVRLDSGALGVGNATGVDPPDGRPVRIDGSVSGTGNLFASESTALTIGGDLQLLGGITTWLGAPPITVDGHAAVSTTSLTIRGPVASYVANTDAVLLTTGEGLIGRFNIVTWGMTTPLVGASLQYSPLDVRVVYTRQDAAMTAMSLSLAPSAVGSATRVEGAFGQIDRGLADGTLVASSEFVTAAGAIQHASEQQLGAMLESLSGEIHDADSAFAALALDGSRRALDRRLDSLGEGMKAGAWSEQLDGMRGWSAFDVDTSGWMLGFDRAWSSDVVVGASVAETSGNAWHAQRYDREHNRQVDGQVYASWNLGEGAYLRGGAAFGHMQRWLRREVLLGAQSHRVSSDYAQRYGALSLQAGHRLRFGNTALTPYAGAQALQLDRDGFNEQGAAGFGLTADKTSMSALQAVAGARMSHHWLGASTRWELSGSVEWQRLLSQSGTRIRARFTGMDAWAPIVGDGLDRDVGVFGLGLEAGIGRRSTLRFDLDSRYGDGEQWAGAQATWSTGF